MRIDRTKENRIADIALLCLLCPVFLLGIILGAAL
jgi:hypothetical protein